MIAQIFRLIRMNNKCSNISIKMNRFRMINKNYNTSSKKKKKYFRNRNKVMVSLVTLLPLIFKSRIYCIPSLEMRILFINLFRIKIMNKNNNNNYRNSNSNSMNNNKILK